MLKHACMHWAYLCTGSDNHVVGDPVHSVRITRLANAYDLSAFYTNIGFVDSGPVDD